MSTFSLELNLRFGNGVGMKNFFDDANSNLAFFFFLNLSPHLS